MSAKDDFLEALDDDFPTALKDLLDRTIPSIPAISFPSEIEPAIIAQGQLAANINLILQQFEGLPVIQMMMHIGQKNKTVQNLLLTSLEFLDRGEYEIEIISPVDGQVFAPSPITFLVYVRIVKGFGEFEHAEVVFGPKRYALVGASRLLVAEITLPFPEDIPKKDTWTLTYPIMVIASFKGNNQNMKQISCTFKSA
jgi:hypothetical protein